jgi:hypothetical protein
MKPETKLGKDLQVFNRIAGATHLIQGIVLLLIMNTDTTIPVVTRFFDQTGDDEIAPVSKVLFEFSVAIIAPIFLLLSAFAHLLISSPSYVRRYEQNIAKGINPVRWWEYAFSSSLMLVVLLMFGGLIELSTVVFVLISVFWRELFRGLWADFTSGFQLTILQMRFRSMPSSVFSLPSYSSIASLSICGCNIRKLESGRTMYTVRKPT